MTECTTKLSLFDLKASVVPECWSRSSGRTRKRDHISPMFACLHWLLVNSRTEFDPLLTYNIWNSLAPSFLTDITVLYRPNRPLCFKLQLVL